MMGIAMLRTLLALLTSSLSSLKSRRELAVENLVLRQQLAVYEREVSRPKLTQTDRAFWLALMRLWPRWRDALVIVKPATVIGWHRKDFKLFWEWKSRRRAGRPPVDGELVNLIRQMATASNGNDELHVSPAGIDFSG